MNKVLPFIYYLQLDLDLVTGPDLAARKAGMWRQP